METSIYINPVNITRHRKLPQSRDILFDVWNA